MDSAAPAPEPNQKSTQEPFLLDPGLPDWKKDQIKRKKRDKAARTTRVNPMVDPSRPLPNAFDMERAVLGAMMQAPDIAVPAAMEKVKPHHFYVPAHRLLYEVMIEMHDKGKPIDPKSITQVLRDREDLDEAGGPAAIAEIYSAAISPGFASYYAGEVQRKGLVRRVILTCADAMERAFGDQENVEEMLDDVEAKILAIRTDEQQKKELTIGERVWQAIERLDHLARNPQGVAGLAVGFEKLDTMTSGLKPGDMFIIAARPAMGKTSLALNMVENVVVDQKRGAIFFSLEMTADQLVQRLICSRARVNMRSLMTGNFLKEGEFGHITYAAGEIGEAKLFIDDTPSISILDLRSKARRWASDKKNDIALIAIDYLQLCRSTSRRAQDNRQQEIAEISAGLKGLAKELEVPIVVLAQLNRNPEQRAGTKGGGGKPRMSDLRESGSIEQDADLVGLLYRPEYYAQEEDEKSENDGIAELLIAKHRNGATGGVPLTFHKELMRFETREGEGSDMD